jgi:hypothetical protein
VEIRPENGTLEVTGGTVEFVYQQTSVEHRVVYAVTKPLP